MEVPILTVFLLEDDPMVSEAIKTALEIEGFEVLCQSTISKAEQTLNLSTDFDIFLLDINLPDGSGLDFCKYLRAKEVNKPIIFLTARPDEEALLSAYDLGGDDFVRKPFSTKELLTRIRYHLNQGTEKDQIIKFHDITLSLSKQIIIRRHLVIKLNRREFQILKAFFEASGAILTREALIEKIAPSSEISDRTIDTHISQLRSKLKKNGLEQIQIESVYGSGYRMEYKL